MEYLNNYEGETIRRHEIWKKLPFAILVEGNEVILIWCFRGFYRIHRVFDESRIKELEMQYQQNIKWQEWVLR